MAQQCAIMTDQDMENLATMLRFGLEFVTCFKCGVTLLKEEKLFLACCGRGNPESGKTICAPCLASVGQ